MVVTRRLLAQGQPGTRCARTLPRRNERVVLAVLAVLAGGTTVAAAEGIERVIERIRAEQPATAVVHHGSTEHRH